MAAGLTRQDVRWMIDLGLLGHREQRPGRALTVRDRFVLTPKGACWAESLLAPTRPGATPERVEQEFPRWPAWDARRRLILCGDRVVKRFRRPAKNQTLILDAFQEEGWPGRIDDPLPAAPQPVSESHLPPNPTARPDRALTIPTAPTPDSDPDLTALLALWDRLPDGGRKLLRQTAETLAGALPRKGSKGRVQS
jgi:hypothetical protein